MSRPSAFFRATAYAAKAGLARIVVRLTPHEVSDGVDHFAVTVLAVRRDGSRAHGPWTTLAELVWDAAAEQHRGQSFKAAELVLLPLLGGGEGGTWHVRLVDAEPCAHDPWSDDPCDACGGVGWVLTPRRDERRAS